MKSVRARLFALLWIIGSLVFLPFLTGAISTILTVQVMETKLTVPKSDGSAATVGLMVDVTIKSYELPQSWLTAALIEQERFNRVFRH